MTQTFTTLRAANAARQAEWDPSDKITLAFRGNEMGGECGEAQNVIKKLERERLGIRGSRATVQELAEELADVVICADLIAMAEGIDLDQAIARKFNLTSEKQGLETRLVVAEETDRPHWVARVMETRDEASGFWTACSGCQESVDGHVSQKDYPYSAVFGCQPGGGCDDCGGLGVKWDNTDYGEMARSILAEMEGEDTPPSETAAIAALRLHDVYLATPQDRGGLEGPKGQALKAFLNAKAAALSDAQEGQA